MRPRRICLTRRAPGGGAEKGESDLKKKGSQGVVIARGTGDGMYVSFPDAPLEAGDEIRFVVREDEENNTALLEKSITAFTDEGKAYIGFTEEETLSLEAGEYVYGVNLIRAGADPVTVIRTAPFVVQEAVARDE